MREIDPIDQELVEIKKRLLEIFPGGKAKVSYAGIESKLYLSNFCRQLVFEAKNKI